MSYETIKLEKKDGVGIITLNTPDNRNALSTKLGRELSQCIDDVEKDDDVKVVVLTGAGKGFCSGAALPEMAQTAEIVLKGGTPTNTIFGPNLREEYDSFLMISYRLNKMARPTIAAVNGTAIGGGFSMALACDMRVAAESAHFQMAFVKRGVIPDIGGTYYLARLVGVAKACEIVLIADMIDAKEALQMGIVNKVVPNDELMKTVMEMAAKLIKNSPLAVQAAKKALYQALIEPDMLQHFRYEIIVNRLLLDGSDFQEGVLSFMEKREPKFTGKWR